MNQYIDHIELTILYNTCSHYIYGYESVCRSHSFQHYTVDFTQHTHIGTPHIR